MNAVNARGDRPATAETVWTFLLAVLVALATLAVTLCLPVPSAQAATGAQMGPGLNLKAGPHHTVSPTLHAGFWILDGKRLVCISYNSKAPDGSVRALSSAVGMPDTESSARANLLVNTYGTSSDAHVAARLWFALATLIAGDPGGQRNSAAKAAASGLRADLPGYLTQLSAQDRAQVTVMVDQSRTHAPYVVRVALTAAVPGSQGSVRVSARGSDGRPAVGRVVALTGTGVTGLVGGRTDPAGTLTAGYTATALTQTVTATITSPSTSTVWINSPSTGRQLVVGGGFTDRTTSAASATLCPLTLQVVTRCACGRGKATRAYEFTAALPGNYRIHLTDAAGKALASAPLTSGQVTLSLPASVAGVRASYDMLTSGRMVAGSYTFDEDVTR